MRAESNRELCVVDFLPSWLEMIRLLTTIRHADRISNAINAVGFGDYQDEAFGE